MFFQIPFRLRVRQREEEADDKVGDEGSEEAGKGVGGTKEKANHFEEEGEEGAATKARLEVTVGRSARFQRYLSLPCTTGESPKGSSSSSLTGDAILYRLSLLLAGF